VLAPERTTVPEPKLVSPLVPASAAEMVAVSFKDTATMPSESVMLPLPESV
jgi:hypothetical protein